MITRRSFAVRTLAAAVSAGLVKTNVLAQNSSVQPSIDSTIDGILLGVQSASFTFSGIGLIGIIETMRDVGLSTIDVMSEHVENFLGAPVRLPGEGRLGPWIPQPRPSPQGRASFPPQIDEEKRAALRTWRLSVDLERFREVHAMFTVAGLNLFSYNLSFDDSFTDEEIERGFLMTEALGTRIITASSPLTIFPRLKPYAERHNVVVALHNHTIGPDDFMRTVELSQKFWINLDVGHFFASGYDPVAFIDEHSARITNLHIKDRKKDNGDSVPFGDGDTPLPAVFHLLKMKHLTMPACIEYVGAAGPAIELASCRQYCKDTIKNV